MASKKRRSTAKKGRKLRKVKSALGKKAHSHGMTIKEFLKATPACGKWSVRRRKSSKSHPCR
jgi:hypothetical protein